MAFYVYILASQRNGTLYTGSTDNLARRIPEHRDRIRRGFTAKYDVDKLVWFQTFDTREGAVKRERQKSRLEAGVDRKDQSGWRDLFESFVSGIDP